MGHDSTHSSWFEAAGIHTSLSTELPHGKYGARVIALPKSNYVTRDSPNA